LNVYLLRHAQSVANLQQKYCGVTDVPLSENGENSLSHVADFFKDKKMDNIYISPLKRCRQTAEIIFGKEDFIIDDGLIEINFGDWEGLHVSEIEKRYEKKWQTYLSGWRKFTFPNGDHLPDYQKKAGQAIRRIVENEKSEDIAIVSHNAFIKAAISYLLTQSNELANHLSIQNGVINLVIWTPEHAKLRLLNY
jgi:alpha-ribazole phosphatase